MYQNPKELRELIRSGDFRRTTSGQCPGYVQTNVVILSQEYASDFQKFCDLNSSACPLLCDPLPAGCWEPKELAVGSNVRTDIPKYVIHHTRSTNSKKEEIMERIDDDGICSPDMVSFFLGCSFTFEQSLINAGLPIRNIEESKNVSMFRTNIQCEGVGRFKCNLVVTMRPMPHERIHEVIEITKLTPEFHGGPIHVGNPYEIGIMDLQNPDFGDAVTMMKDEVPVFWPCGVTAIESVNNANIYSITHAPGHMFITDKRT